MESKKQESKKLVRIGTIWCYALLVIGIILNPGLYLEEDTTSSYENIIGEWEFFFLQCRKVVIQY